MAIVAAMIGGMIGFLAGVIAFATGASALVALAVWSVLGLTCTVSILLIAMIPARPERIELTAERA